MPAACKVLNFSHLIFGVDLHKNIPPPPTPAGPVPLPHIVATMIGDAMLATTKDAKTVKAGGANAVARQHDIGMGQWPAAAGYHVGANVLLPIVWFGAGNKSEFGCASVVVPTGRIAVACVPWVGLNPQLDCNEPFPFVRSVCFACTNTVTAGMTFGDFMGGLVAGIVDSVAVFVVGKITGAIVGLAGAGVAAILEAAGPEALLVAGLLAANPVGASVIAVIGESLNLGLGFLIGTPLGYAFPLPWTGWGGSLNDAINDSISPPPGTKSVPPPTSGGGEGAEGRSGQSPDDGGGGTSGRGPAATDGASSDPSQEPGGFSSDPSQDPGGFSSDPSQNPGAQDPGGFSSDPSQNPGAQDPGGFSSDPSQDPGAQDPGGFSSDPSQDPGLSTSPDGELPKR